MFKQLPIDGQRVFDQSIDREVGLGPLARPSASYRPLLR
jgi:hypothetical protein